MSTKPMRPKFVPGDLETLNKMYLELSLVCDGAKTWRDIANEKRIDELESALQDALALTHVPDHSQDDTWYAERERLQKVADNG